MTKLKLIFPLWRGGNNPLYSLGTSILKNVLPDDKSFIVKEVKIKKKNYSNLQINKVFHQNQIIDELNEAKNIINTIQPNKIITLGGDCLISQQPIDYLNGKYENFCVIWFDAHPDISNPEIHHNEHAMVLANLLHKGDSAVENIVNNKLNSNQIIYFGLNYENISNFEKEKYNELNLKNITINEIRNNDFIAFDNWVTNNNFRKAYIHIDLDVLDPSIFHSLYFTNSEINKNNIEGIASGGLSFEMLNNSIKYISEKMEIVGFSIAEFLPWDVKNIINMFNNIKI